MVLLGLRARRVDLERRRIEVVEVRYDAGKFGSGYKDRPKSDASIRLVPLADPVAEALARRLDGCPPDGLVFCGPGGGYKVPRGPAPGSRSATTDASTTGRLPEPASPALICTAPTICDTPSRPGWRTAASPPA